MFKIVPDNFVKPRWFSSRTTSVRPVDMFAYTDVLTLKPFKALHGLTGWIYSYHPAWRPHYTHPSGSQRLYNLFHTNCRTALVLIQHDFCQCTEIYGYMDVLNWENNKKMVGRAGFEPATNWLKVNCSTSWANDPFSFFFASLRRRHIILNWNFSASLLGLYFHKSSCLLKNRAIINLKPYSH